MAWIFTQGEPAIYRLLEVIDIDGCILEANLGSNELAEHIVSILKKTRHSRAGHQPEIGERALPAS